MPVRYNNTFQAASPIGQAMQNLSQAVFSGPTAAERQAQAAQTRLYQARADKAAREAEELSRRMSGRSEIADIFRSADFTGQNYQPSADMVVENAGLDDIMGSAQRYATDQQQYRRGQVADAFSSAFSTGTAAGMDQETINALLRNAAAQYGTDDDLIRFRAAGDTGPIGENEAVSLGGQYAIRQGNDRQERTIQGMENQARLRERAMIEQGDINEIYAAPLTYGPEETVRPNPNDPRTKGAQGYEAQLGSRLLQGESLNEQQAAALGADGSQRTPRNYAVYDEQGNVVAQGITLDGRTDAQTGEPIPAGEGTRRSISTAQIQTDDPSNLTTATQSKVQETELAMRRFNDLLAQTRAAADDPSNFGFPGFVKGTVQDVQALGEGLAAGLGYDGFDNALASVRRDIAQNPDVSADIFSGIFDPSLPKLQTLSDLLVYQAASALANQSGRSVSDRDVKIFKNIVGDPQSFFSNKEKFLSKLNTMEEMVRGQREALRPDGGQQPGGSGGGSQRMRYNPSTGELEPVQ
jgi:hypothetical protein